MRRAGIEVVAAPCQPFSRQRRGRATEDPRSYLLLEFLRFVEALRPDFIFCENVPEARNWEGTSGSPGRDLLEALHCLNYAYRHGIVDCRDYGVPQRRARWVLTASRRGKIGWPHLTHGPGRARPWSTVSDWIGAMPPLVAGQIDAQDPIHRSANLSPRNLARIRATPVGGSRLDWPRELLLSYHTQDTSSFSDVYGRLRLGEPATAMTTRCISLSNGRFGHPTQDRAISARGGSLADIPSKLPVLWNS